MNIFQTWCCQLCLNAATPFVCAEIMFSPNKYLLEYKHNNEFAQKLKPKLQPDIVDWFMINTVLGC